MGIKRCSGQLISALVWAAGMTIAPRERRPRDKVLQKMSFEKIGANLVIKPNKYRLDSQSVVLRLRRN